MSEETWYDQVVGFLDTISMKLEKNNDYIKQLIGEVRYSTIATNSRFYKSDKINRILLDSLDPYTYSERSALFVGYNQSKLQEFVEKVAKSLRVHVKFAQGLKSGSELVSTIVGLSSGDVLFLDLREIIRIPEGISILKEVIETSKITFKIGSGQTARDIILDIAEILFIYLYSPELLLPEELISSLSSVYINSNFDC